MESLEQGKSEFQLGKNNGLVIFDWNTPGFVEKA